jgi:hypothetical protein
MPQQGAFTLKMNAFMNGKDAGMPEKDALKYRR